MNTRIGPEPRLKDLNCGDPGLPAAAGPRYRFGGFELDPASRRLSLRDTQVRVGGRAFDLLCKLVEHRDRVVGRAELIEHVWPDSIVEPNNLQVQVCALRRALGRQSIATIDRRGYRFVLPVDVLVPPGMPGPASAGGNRTVRGFDAIPMAGLWTSLARTRLLTVVTVRTPRDARAMLARRLPNPRSGRVWEMTAASFVARFKRGFGGTVGARSVGAAGLPFDRIDVMGAVLVLAEARRADTALAPAVGAALARWADLRIVIVGDGPVGLAGELVEHDDAARLADYPATAAGGTGSLRWRVRSEDLTPALR